MSDLELIKDLELLKSAQLRDLGSGYFIEDDLKHEQRVDSERRGLNVQH